MASTPEQRSRRLCCIEGSGCSGKNWIRSNPWSRTDIFPLCEYDSYQLQQAGNLFPERLQRKWCSDLLDPASHLRLVAPVLLAEPALQVAFPPLDNATLDYEDRHRQK